MSAIQIENDPSHWHKKANEAREQAIKMPNKSLRLMTLAVASGYEALAARAEERRLRQTR